MFFLFFALLVAVYAYGFFNKKPIALILIYLAAYIFQFESQRFFNTDLLTSPIAVRFSDPFLFLVFIIGMKNFFENFKLVTKTLKQISCFHYS